MITEDQILTALTASSTPLPDAVEITDESVELVWDTDWPQPGFGKATADSLVAANLNFYDPTPGTEDVSIFCDYSVGTTRVTIRRFTRQQRDEAISRLPAKRP
jgi:hypothetical protein